MAAVGRVNYFLEHSFINNSFLLRKEVIDRNTRLKGGGVFSAGDGVFGGNWQ